MATITKDKVTKAAKTAGKTVVENPKTVVYVGIGVAAVFLGYKLIKGINDLFFGDGNVSNSIPFGFSVNMGSLSITNEQATNYASQLLDAFNHKQFNPFGLPTSAATDEDKIEQIFDRINVEDFKLIYNKFGQKDYATLIGGSPPANWIGGQISEKRDLIWWLKEELNSVLDRTLYNKVKTKVEAAGAVF